MCHLKGSREIRVFWNGMMSTALLWDVAERVVVIHTDVLGQPIAPFIKGQELLTIEFGRALDVPKRQ